MLNITVLGLDILTANGNSFANSGFKVFALYKQSNIESIKSK